MTHICVGKLTNIGSDNGLSPGRRQAFIWTNAGILLIGPLGTNFSEFLIIIHTFSFNKMQLKMSSAKWRPFCLGLNVLSYFLPCCVHMRTWLGVSYSLCYWMQNVSFIDAVRYLIFTTSIALEQVRTKYELLCEDSAYSISQEICTPICCALLCCGYAIVHNEFTWSIYPYSSGLLCWHWGNR